MQKIPHQLESLIPKWTIKRLQKAWLFTCLTCGDEYECTCFPSGAITPKQFNHLRYHRHSKPSTVREVDRATGARADGRTAEPLPDEPSEH